VWQAWWYPRRVLKRPVKAVHDPWGHHGRNQKLAQTQSLFVDNQTALLGKHSGQALLSLLAHWPQSIPFSLDSVVDQHHSLLGFLRYVASQYLTGLAATNEYQSLPIGTSLEILPLPLSHSSRGMAISLCSSVCRQEQAGCICSLSQLTGRRPPSRPDDDLQGAGCSHCSRGLGSRAQQQKGSVHPATANRTGESSAGSVPGFRFLDQCQARAPA